MLHAETKRKIDNARDILVGKIPVPSAQIELITIALVYKFMSDIDSQNKELWWAGFFVWDYEKYSRSHIMDRKLGAHDRLYLYSEWLDKMGTNPNLPQMFRDIFRNAFLPFKDPQTLDRFLKQINEFSYDHSEELGNAFEYLLSTAGSQWDAGQFRTPRHIIDFIVQVVEPKYTDTILDPACGTAGFLISAYKYILQSNTEKTLWDKLTLAQKNKLTDNFVGYDISHEMVRLSLVNLYLHNFWDPKIFEYDTLSSDERRDDRFDCILANPPFMTPKGGIQPHSRFSIKASKSEVLFVDYMMEHLNPQGKAWIIVPEGIIFQSANAYKSLRKKMIEENYLRAVVSLPSGVFQPYSGVKTSILLFDKELAKKSDNILFVKVNHDGFDLWAQRRESNKNDLPQALEELLDYKKALTEWSVIASETKQSNSVLVPKSDIIANGDYNLSMERYRESEVINSKWDMVELWEVCDIQNGYAFDSKKFNETNWFPLIRIRNIKTNRTDTLFEWEYSEEYVVKNWDLLIWMDWEFNNTIRKWWDALLNQRVCRLQKFNWVIKEYINFLIGKELKKIEDSTVAITVKHISSKQILEIKIPLPPLAIQEQIVEELDRYQKIVNGAKQVVENWKPTIEIDPEREMVELGEYIDINNWEVLTEFDNDWKNACIKVSDMNLTKNQNEIVTSSHWTNKNFKKIVPINSIIFPKRWAAIATNKKRITKIPCYIDNNCMAISVTNKKLNHDYLYNFMLWFDLTSISNSAWIALINNPDIKQVKIPLPPIETQEKIVDEIEKQRKDIEVTDWLAQVFEYTIEKRIKRVWGEEEEF